MASTIASDWPQYCHNLSQFLPKCKEVFECARYFTQNIFDFFFVILFKTICDPPFAIFMICFNDMMIRLTSGSFVRLGIFWILFCISEWYPTWYNNDNKVSNCFLYTYFPTFYSLLWNIKKWRWKQWPTLEITFVVRVHL